MKKKIESNMIYLCNGERPNCHRKEEWCLKRNPEGVCKFTLEKEFAADPNPVAIDTGEGIVWLKRIER